MSDSTTFHVKINDGPEQTITVNTTIYVSAVAAVPALLGVNKYPLTVEIWVPSLLPDYGPYTYVIPEAGAAPVVGELYRYAMGRRHV